MARKGVKLYIDSDVTGVKRGVGQAQSSLRSFEGQAKRSQGSMSRLGSSAAGLGLAFGATGLALGLKSSIDAFKEQEKSTARVIATLKTLGINTDAVRKKIADVTAAQSKLSGFQDEDLQASFAGILRVTGDVNESLKLNALAMDISRGSGKNLNVVAQAIAKVMDGNVAALGRYGVKAQKGATITDVLALAQKRYAGQAREFGNTTAGAAEKANAQINELQESIGAKLAPAMNSAAGATISMANATQSLVDHAGGLGPVVSGAAGFGAFQILAPQVGRFAGGVKSIGAETKLAGGGLKGFGSAVGGMINPMTVAAVGAGLLAGGIYEVWHNSENAEQAVQGLNDKVRGLNDALDQKTTARDRVKSAQDYVTATKDAEAAARSHAAALHGDIVQLQTHKGTQAQVTAATAKWQKALADIVPAVHAKQRAQHELDSANKNVEASTGGVADAEAELARKSRDVIKKSQEAAFEAKGLVGRYGPLEDRTYGVGDAAAYFARKMEDAAGKTKAADKATRDADKNLAGFARRMGRVPTVKEIKLITRYTHQGLSLDEIAAKLGGITNKVVTVTTRSKLQPFKYKTDPLTGQLVPAAGGAYVAGDYSKGDRVPAMLAGGEAVLNPLQIGMVDSGMSVMGALSATGAPTIGAGGLAGGGMPGPKRRRRQRGVFRPGALLDASQVVDERFMGKPYVLVEFEDGSKVWMLDPRPGGLYTSDRRDIPGGGRGYAKGGKPARGSLAALLARGTKASRGKHATPADLVGAALGREGVQWDSDAANSALRIAQADAAGDASGNVRAYQQDIVSQVAMQKRIRAILGHPAKTLGVFGGRLSQEQRTTLTQALAQAIEQVKSDNETIYGLQHPAADDSGAAAGGDTSSGAGPAAYDPAADLQAQLDQSERNRSIAVRGGQLSEATLRTLTGTGDIGIGGGPRVTMMQVLGDQRSLQALAAGMSTGAGLQPSRAANRATINI